MFCAALFTFGDSALHSRKIERPERVGGGEQNGPFLIGDDQLEAEVGGGVDPLIGALHDQERFRGRGDERLIEAVGVLIDEHRAFL